MFDKTKFSTILKRIIYFYDSIRDFSKTSGFNRTSLSEYIRCEVKNPPTPVMLKRIAYNSKGVTTYMELMHICGYIENEEVSNMYNREKFSEILKQISSEHSSMGKFADDAGMDRGYLSRNINNKLDNPPGPDILRGIADASKGITTYVELLEVCGYLTEEDLDDFRKKSDNETMELKSTSNIEETTEKVRELVSLLERANELINSLSKK